MRQFNFNYRGEKLLESKQERWMGLNTLVSATQVKPTEMVEAVDVQLVEDGKIQCPRDGQAYYGATSGSRVTGLFTYYKSDGTRQLLRSVGTELQKYVDASTWSAVSGMTYTTGLNTNGVMAYDKLYLCNGTDNLTYYNGTDITTFTERSAPTISSVTRTGGSAGSYTYSYKVSVVTAVGETTPSTASTATADWATADSTHYMTVVWGSVTGAVGYNVYGRKDGQWYFMAYVEGNSSTTYVDNGSDTPQESFTPPEGNSTGGQKGKYVAMYKDSLFIFGDSSNPSRLYYSGGGDQIENFTIGGGGGFIDISKNDGQVGTGMIVFKNSLIVFKERSTYQFSFTSDGLPQVVQVNPVVGCIAPRSIAAVENDVFFLSERGIFTVGNEAGFAFDVLRTNELSARVRSVVQTIDPAYVSNASAIYATAANKNLYILSYTPSGSTTNSKALVFDRERNGWVKWTNIQANCWATWKDSTSTTHYLYGDDSSGYLKEVLTGTTDFGAGIHGYFYLKGEPFNGIHQYKNLKDVDVVLRRPSGSISLTVVKDGVETALTTPIGTVSPSINFGHYLFARFLFVSSYGTGVSSADEIVGRTKKNINLEGRTFQLRFDNNSSATFVLLFAGMTSKPRSPRYRKSTDLIS